MSRTNAPLDADPTVKGLLARVARADMAACGILIDHLEETGHPKWKALRKHWNRRQERIAYWEAQPDRRFRDGWLRWECIANEQQHLRSAVARAFGRKWNSLPLKRIAAVNQYLRPKRREP